MNIYPTTEQRFSPFEFYSFMRKNNSITFDEKSQQWGVYCYNDIEKILMNHKTFSSNFPTSQIPQEYQENLTRPNLLNSDPPYHRKLRNVVDTLFVPIEISQLEKHIKNIANTLIDKTIEKDDSTMDLITDFAYPLPATVIAELLGIPSDDQGLFQQWADVIVSLEGDHSTNINSLARFNKTINEMDIYFDKLIEKKKKIPQDDLISHIIKAEVEGHSLSKKEILSFCELLLNAGHITTVNLIGNLIFSLLENPLEFTLLQQNPSLIKSAIEETLRYRSPVQVVTRMVKTDISLHEENKQGQKNKHEIKKGSEIMLFLGSANRDESIFSNPEQFNINRKNLRHLGFGSGIHFCLGAPLARLEGQIALRTILERLDNIQFNFDYNSKQDLYSKINTLDSYFFLGLSKLPLKFKIKNI